MKEYIVELSKYINIIIISLYVFFSYLSFSVKNKYQEILYGIQVFLIIFLQTVCFLDISIIANNVKYLYFYVFVQLLIIVTIMIANYVYENINKLLLNNMCMLLGIGLFEISRLSFVHAQRQFIIVAITLLVSLFIPFTLMHIKFLRKIKYIYALLGIGLLSCVLVLGELTHGSKITYTLGTITFQPSEFVKILFVFFLAAALWEDTSIKQLIMTSIIAAMQVVILVISKDLGSALILFISFSFIVFVATGKVLYLLLLSLFGGASATIAYFIFDHVRIRVLAWRDPFSYIDAQGYQITQSLFAIGSGSFFGMGIMQGNPTAIPYVRADFIFSAICEEYGTLFGIFLILLCLNCFISIIQIALRVRDRFYQLITYGIGIIYIFQTFLTIGGGTKFIPLTGVTLPFLSYGGSSAMASIIMFFIVQGINIRLIAEGNRRNVKSEKRN